MIGYGDLVRSTALAVTKSVVELRASSFLSGGLVDRKLGRRALKLALNVDRFLISPISVLGAKCDLAHVVDPANIHQLDFIRHAVSVVTVHDMIPYLCALGELEGFTPSRFGRSLLSQTLQRISRVDVVICPSEASRRDLQRFLPNKSPSIVVIANALFQASARVTADERREFRSRLGAEGDEPILLHIGAGFYKNRRVVVEVFAQISGKLPTARLVMIGPREPDLADMVAKYRLHDRVTFLERATASQVQLAYGSSDVLVFPSLYEGFGYPVVEAQIAGLPVVASNAGALPEVAGQGGLLFCPTDVVGMADATLRILGDRQERELLVAEGRKNAARFCSDRFVAAHKSIYTRFLGVTSGQA